MCHKNTTKFQLWASSKNSRHYQKLTYLKINQWSDGTKTPIGRERMISILLDKKTEEVIDDHLKQKNSNYHSFPFERTHNSCFQRKAQIPKFQTKMAEEKIVRFNKKDMHVKFKPWMEGCQIWQWWTSPDRNNTAKAAMVRFKHLTITFNFHIKDQWKLKIPQPRLKQKLHLQQWNRGFIIQAKFDNLFFSWCNTAVQGIWRKNSFST